MSEEQALPAQPAKATSPARIRRIHIVINPASGQDRPVLNFLNDAFHPAGIEWDVSITLKAGDARRYAVAALDTGVDAVGVFGGDGTVGEVAGGLVGSGMPLAIFPGGTGNVMTVELGIPSDLRQACTLVSDGTGVVRAIDVVDIGDHVVLCRLTLGLEAGVMEQTDRAQKDKYGWLAYGINGLRQLSNPQHSKYSLTIDGEAIETEGVVCMVVNSGIFSPNTGMPGQSVIRLSPTISVTDGLLDVLVVRNVDIGYLASLAQDFVAHTATAQPLLHWTGREVSVVADPPQAMQYDGEFVGHRQTITARVRPQALRVIVPASAASPTGTPP